MSKLLRRDLLRGTARLTDEMEPLRHAPLPEGDETEAQVAPCRILF
jgi:hypothetical protein